MSAKLKRTLTIHVKGYEYTRKILLRTYRRRVRSPGGKIVKRLVKVFKTVEIVVPGYTYKLRRKIALPSAVPVRRGKKPVALPPSVGKRKRPAKSLKPRRKHKAVAIPPAVKKRRRPRALPPAKPKVSWVPVPRYLDSLRREHGEIDFSDAIYRVRGGSPGNHFIRTSDLLVWETPKHVFISRTVVVIRVWLLIHDKQQAGDRSEYFVASRSRAFGLRKAYWESQKHGPRMEEDSIPKSPDSWKKIIFWRDDIRDSLEDWAKDKDYLESRGLIAWTYWYSLTFAPSRKASTGEHEEEAEG